MLQLTQKLGDGDMRVQKVPRPLVGRGMILVQNAYSIISLGTEGSTVRAARSSLLEKARQRPQQARQVIRSLKLNGVVQTYTEVEKKLEAYQPLGYSCAGRVIEIGEDVTGYDIGDLVACSGAGYANHAELVAVPVNLCAKLAHDADLRDAAYNTLGAIAMQAVRQADARIGESCVVIGLGLLGQLSGLILRASGVKVVGVDISKVATQKALAAGAIDVGFERGNGGIIEKIFDETGGFGADVVIIAAATDSVDPINFAGRVVKKKGSVVVLGAVPTGFDREPDWYKKELVLKMACSYGPGRYDPQYEEKGVDYPYAYVRWTEQRNMQAFQELIAKGVVRLDALTTHEFSFSEAPEAYDLINDSGAYCLGVVLKYDSQPNLTDKLIISDRNAVASSASRVTLSFIGAGNYAQSYLLPNIDRHANVVKRAVLTATGTTSKRVAEKFGFESCTSDVKNIFGQDTNTVFIATRHDSHAQFVKMGLQSGKNIFVEKPLCLNSTELDEIVELYNAGSSRLMVGFNRRFSRHAVQLKSRLPEIPMSMSYRVNAGRIPEDSWIHDRTIGGGRIIGEVCHFIDFMTFICGSAPCKVSANSISQHSRVSDIVNISITFENGSIGVISYFSNGAENLEKEYFEVHGAGLSAVLRDFKELRVYKNGKTTVSKTWSQDKGHKSMIDSYLSCVLDSDISPIRFSEIVATTRTCFATMESLDKSGEVILVNSV